MKLSLPIWATVVVLSALVFWRPWVYEHPYSRYDRSWYPFALVPSILGVLTGIIVFQLGKRTARRKPSMTRWRRIALGLAAFVVAAAIGVAMAEHTIPQPGPTEHTDLGGGAVALAVIALNGLISGAIGAAFGAGLGQTAKR